MQVAQADVENLIEGFTSEVSGFVKGIIKKKSDATEKKSSGLVIWIDIQKMIENAAKK